jgi:L-2,4-diaminobutyric acid acetyltransferase
MQVPRDDNKAARIREDAASKQVVFRRPSSLDGSRIWRLVAACPPLDQNSMYCNLLQCRDFAETSVLAELQGEAVGWVSGYRRPDDPASLFIWQVAVHERARGLGLARKMLFGLLERQELRDVVRMQTTITPDNHASHALFRSVAERADAALEETDCFDEERHFEGRHASERLITIGPFNSRRNARSAA